MLEKLNNLGSICGKRNCQCLGSMARSQLREGAVRRNGEGSIIKVAILESVDIVNVDGQPIPKQGQRDVKKKVKSQIGHMKMKAQCKLCSDNALQAKNIVFFPLQILPNVIPVFSVCFLLYNGHQTCTQDFHVQSCYYLAKLSHTFLLVYSPFIATNANVPLAFLNI